MYFGCVTRPFLGHLFPLLAPFQHFLSTCQPYQINQYCSKPAIVIGRYSGQPLIFHCSLSRQALIFQNGNLLSGSLESLIQHLVPTADYYPDVSLVLPPPLPPCTLLPESTQNACPQCLMINVPVLADRFLHSTEFFTTSQLVLLNMFFVISLHVLLMDFCCVVFCCCCCLFCFV